MSKNQKTPFEYQAEDRKSDFGLEYLDLFEYRKSYWNLSTDGYYQEALFRGEGIQTPQGALIVRSGERTARSANDKFIVKEDSSADDISWGEYNTPFSEADFDRIFNKMRQFLVGKDIFIQDGIAGASPQHQIPVRVISTWAWFCLLYTSPSPRDRS